MAAAVRHFAAGPAPGIEDRPAHLACANISTFKPFSDRFVPSQIDAREPVPTHHTGQEPLPKHLLRRKTPRGTLQGAYDASLSTTDSSFRAQKHFALLHSSKSTAQIPNANLPGTCSTCYPVGHHQASLHSGQPVGLSFRQRVAASLAPTSDAADFKEFQTDYSESGVHHPNVDGWLAPSHTPPYIAAWNNVPPLQAHQSLAVPQQELWWDQRRHFVPAPAPFVSSIAPQFTHVPHYSTLPGFQVAKATTKECGPVPLEGFGQGWPFEILRFSASIYHAMVRCRRRKTAHLHRDRKPTELHLTMFPRPLSARPKQAFAYGPAVCNENPKERLALHLDMSAKLHASRDVQSQHAHIVVPPDLPTPVGAVPECSERCRFVPGLCDSLTHIAIQLLQVLQAASSHLASEGDAVVAMIGCLKYMLSDYCGANVYFSKLLDSPDMYSAALPNVAVSLVAMREINEAERLLREKINLEPADLAVAEDLLNVLCTYRRYKDAIDLISDVQIRLANGAASAAIQVAASRPHCGKSHDPSSPTGVAIKVERNSVEGFNPRRLVNDDSLYEPWVDRRYACVEHENGRLMALIHAKGNMLYGGHDFTGAAKAFEEVIMVALAYPHGSIANLTEHVRSVLAPVAGVQSASVPLLLLPAVALETARLCFGPSRKPPGLLFLRSTSSAKAAMSVLSNALLSLAKILQDGMASSSSLQLSSVFHYGISDILALYYLSLSLSPSPSTANNLGILLTNIPPNYPAPLSGGAKDDFYMFPGVPPGSGVAMALTYYKYGLSLDPNHAHLYTNLGSLLKDIGQLPLAVQMYERAVTCDPEFDIALANLANAVKDSGRVLDAINFYRRAVRVNPNFAEAVCGLANALNSVCDWTGRGGVIFDHYDRWHVDDTGMVVDSKSPGFEAHGWLRQVINIVEKQLLDGRSWGSGIVREQTNTLLEFFMLSTGSRSPFANFRDKMELMLREWDGSNWEGAKFTRFIERATRLLTWQWYHDKHRGGIEMAKYPRPRFPATLSVPSAPTVLPFHTFTLPMTAQQIRLISQRNALRTSASVLRSLPDDVFPPPRPPQPMLNVLYLSSDFNNHPLAHLMQSVFGMHDPQRVKAICFATTPSDNSPHRRKIEEEAPVFRDVSALSNDEIITAIVNLNVHVLINLNGYTRGARNEIFAARPSPVQMAFMGFAGSLGAEWCDYLLADETSVPLSTLRPYRRNVDLDDLREDQHFQDDLTEWVYSENIIYTRDAFFCCDHRQCGHVIEKARVTTFKLPRAPSTWDEEMQARMQVRRELFPDLPHDGLILANFNQLYKIDPSTFRSWLRILAALPNAILWLLRFPELGEVNLMRTARAWAGSAVASRIRFTAVAAKAVHIARGCAADLFLDTPECNAHTTAADCLWSGTPVLTVARYEWKMCSRMAAAILRGALPHGPAGERAWQRLVADSEEEYEARAIALGRGLSYAAGSTGKGELMELRRLIWEGRWESGLFDTRRWVRDLEAAYHEAWRRWEAGEGGDIWIKDLVE